LLPKLVNSIVLWKNCDKKENTSEFEYGYQYRYCAALYVPVLVFCRVASRIRYFSVGIGRYFSVFTIPIPKENSVSIFGIKLFSGAPQKIGGSPLFPKKGGPQPPLRTLRRKKGIPTEFFQKKSSRDILKRCFRQNLQYNNTDRKYRYRLYLIPGNTDTEKMTGSPWLYFARLFWVWYGTYA
jgi:hypothetical protein